MVRIQMRESAIAVGTNRVGVVALVDFGVDRNRASACTDDLTFKSNDFADKHRETEIDAMLDKQHYIFRIKILIDSEIRTFNQPFGATASKESFMMIQVSDLDEMLGNC